MLWAGSDEGIPAMRASTAKVDWLHTYYGHLDANNVDGFMAMLAPGARQFFANAEPREGKDAIRAALSGFLDSLGGIRHVLRGAWEEDDDLLIFESEVHYLRKDGKEVVVPSSCFFVVGDDGLCREQRIMVDTSPVFA